MASNTTDSFDSNVGNYFDEYESGSSGVAQLDLQHSLRVLRKYKWAITLFTAVITCLAAYYAFTAAPIYRSTSTLLIESQNEGVTPFEDLLAGDTTNSEYYQTQFELLKSRELAKRVIDKLGLHDHPEFSFRAIKAASGDAISNSENLVADNISDSGDEKNSSANTDAASSVLVRLQNQFGGLLDKVPESWIKITGDEKATEQVASDDLSVLATTNIAPANEATSELADEQLERSVIQRFQSRLSITPVRKTKLVQISFESTDRAFAAEVANAVGEQYILANLDARMADTLKISSWMNDQIDTLKDRLEDSEQRLLDYRLSNGLVDAGGGVTGVQEQQIMLLTQELLRAENDLAAAASVRNEARSMRGNVSLLETLPSVQADTIVRDVKLQIGQQQRQLDELSTRYGQRHPKIKDANSQLFSLQSTLEQNVNRVVGTIENEFQLASQRVSSLRGSLAEGENKLQNTGGKTFELDKLEREVETNQSVYDEFRTRRTEAQSAEGLESPNARISDPAVAAANPIKPRKGLIIALAALGSLILSALMALLYEQMDDTVKSAEDVERKIGVRLLGILPLVKSGMFGGKQALPLNPAEIKDKKGTFVESINTARTAICLDDGGHHRRVILVTSSVPGEGKSTTSLNLAYSLSQMERTLLIDCDLRRPTIAAAINLPKHHPGLSSMISGTVPAIDCIQRSAIGDLDVICSGPMPDQPLELLSSDRFAKIITQLSNHYDRIVLDCAPVQAVSDALVLSQLSDTVVYNVKSHDTPIDLVKRGLKRFKQVNAKVAGVLITQVDIDKLVSYGGDHYYQGYYDYYGYNTEGEALNNKLVLSHEEITRIREENTDIEYDFGLQQANANGTDSHTNGFNGAHHKVGDAQSGHCDHNGFDLDATHMINSGDKYDRLADNTNSRRRNHSKQQFADDLDLL